MADETVGAGYARLVIEGAKAAGVDVEQLLAAAGIAAEAIADPDGWVRHDQQSRLWDEVARRSNDDCFGLHLAQKVKPGAFSVLDYVVRNAPTLGEGYLHVVRYSRLIHAGALVQLDFDDAGDTARMSYTLPGHPGGSSRQAAEFIVATWVTVGRQVTEIDFAPQQIYFQHPRPPDISEHRRIFRCPVAFDAEANEMVLARSLLGKPLAQADPTLAVLLRQYADDALAKQPAQESFVVKIRRLVADSLRQGDSTLDPIAKKMGMSTRTLQRRLKEEGTSHQELLDDMRRELAQKYLQEPTIAIGEAAFLLGFSEPSAFHRAFKRWTGSTPGEFRRQATQAQN